MPNCADVRASTPPRAGWRQSRVWDRTPPQRSPPSRHTWRSSRRAATSRPGSASRRDKLRAAATSGSGGRRRWRDEAVPGKARDEGLGVPVAEGGMVDQARADGGPADGLDKVGLQAGFVLCPAGDCAAICREGMKTSLSSMLAMSGWKVSTPTFRRSATAGRRISLAYSVFHDSARAGADLPTDPRCTDTPCSVDIPATISSSVSQPLTPSRSLGEPLKKADLPSA